MADVKFIYPRLKVCFTSTNLTELVNLCAGMMENGVQIDVVYTNFANDFDRILHRLLWKKLYKMIIHSSLIE